MFSCRKATHLISQAHEQPLRLADRMALQFHLAMCSACRQFGKNSKTLSSAMREFSKQP